MEWNLQSLKSLSKGKGLRFMEAKENYRVFLLLEVFIKNYSCYPYLVAYTGELQNYSFK